MPYATWLPDILRDAGLTVRTYTGWASRGSSFFSPRGVILHHTVTSPSTDDWLVDRMLAITGSSKVNPPLANWSTNRDGSVSVIAAGTANHGGIGTWNGVSGNRFWFGDEMKNLGTSAEPWQARQVESALRAAAAVLTHIGSDASWMCGHKEYATPPGRKVDPHSLNMDSLRTAVAELMEDPDMAKIPLESWAVNAFKFFIAEGIYTQEKDLSKIRETYDFQRTVVNDHRQILKYGVNTGGAPHDHDGRYVKNIAVSR